MSTADRWRKVMLIKEALKEVSAHVPEIQVWTDQELRNIQRLNYEVQRIVTNGVKEHPSTFLLFCEVLGLDPNALRQRLGA